MITCESSPKVSSMTKKSNDQSGEIGRRVTTSGYTINARPAPWSTTLSTSTRSSWARKPIMQNMTRPAKNDVNMFATATINASLMDRRGGGKVAGRERRASE